MNHATVTQYYDIRDGTVTLTVTVTRPLSPGQWADLKPVIDELATFVQKYRRPGQ